MRRNMIALVISLVIFLTLTVDVSASYTKTADDSTDYDYADYSASIWGFSSISQSKYTGEQTVLGASPAWGGLHTCRLDMYMKFTAEEDGKIYCKATWSMSWRLEAVQTTGAYAKIWVYYVLYSSSRTYIEKSTSVFYRSAYRSSYNVYKEGIQNEDGSISKQFSTVLNSGSQYYVSVRLYCKVNGCYGHIYAKGSTSALTLDIQEITVWR